MRGALGLTGGADQGDVGTTVAGNVATLVTEAARRQVTGVVQTALSETGGHTRITSRSTLGCRDETRLLT